MDVKAKNRIKRTLLWLGGALLVALAAWSFRPRPVLVEVAEVERGPLRVTVDGDGKTRVKERYVVAAPLGGSMARITLHAGDRIDESTPITVITPMAPPLLDVRSRAEAESRVKLAEASLERSQANVETAREVATHAQAELDRQALLLSRGAAARAQYDESATLARTKQRELDAARFALEADRQQVAVSRAALFSPGAAREGGRAIVHAPVAGTILRVLKEDAGPVSMGAPLVEVGDLAQLELVVDLISTEAVQVEPGFEALVEHWGGAAQLAARVRRVEPSAFTKVSALGVEEQRVNVVVDLVSSPRSANALAVKDPPPPLGDGYHAEVRIVVWQIPDAVRVPLGALFREGDSWAVFVVEGGVARKKLLRIGHRDSSAAEVEEGVTPGQRVIIHPGDKVKDGSKVAEG